MPKCKNDPSKNYKGDEPSPKGLGYCAHAEKIGKRMEGKNGFFWIVKKLENGSKRWVKDDAVIFVLYTLNKEGYWEYKNFPKNWDFSGSGYTNPVNKEAIYKYQREEQFNGDMKNREKMKEYLKKIFDKLKKDKIIKYYKIKYSYKPE